MAAFNPIRLIISAAPDDLLSITKIAGLTWDQWNARLAMPLITQLREGRSPIQFGSDLSATSSPIVNSLIKNGQAAALLSRGVTNALSNNCSISIHKEATFLSENNGSVGNGSGSQSGELKYDHNGSPDEGISEGTNSSFGYTCGDCGRVYKLKSSLRNHQKWECGKDPQFQCPLCAYRAKQKMHIIRHMGRMHKNQSLELVDEDFVKMTVHKDMEESAINMGV